MKWYVRSMRPGDEQAVAKIEQLCFEFPQTPQDVKENVEARHWGGFSCCYQTRWQHERMVGYLILEYRASSIRIHRFATHPDARRKGIGKLLLAAALDQLTDARPKCLVDVQETNRDACEFLKALGFRSKLVRGLFDDLDGVRFQMGLEVVA